MKKKLQSINIDQPENLNPISTPNTFLMGGALVGLNLLLMIGVGFYWINPKVHLYLSGRPL